MEASESALFDARVAGVFEDDPAGGSEEAFLINPSRRVVESVVTDLEPNRPESLRLFAAEDPLKELFDEFTVASATADLVESDVLSIRLLESVPRHSLLLTDERIVSIVDDGDRIRGLATGTDSLVADAYERYRERWERAEGYSLRAPPLSRIERTLRRELGAPVATDFDRALSAVEEYDGAPVDEVAAALLVAAKHDELLYDISQWGEEVGLASKATFSRTKNRLEETDILDTNKVPIDVGRPRLRLTLGPDGLAEAAPEAVVETAADRLA